ncbi:hypothetical protein [Catenulispora rubra]|uniref:hypothetical protein n=1 Tax=Catenulispora rubra TaxID=280293 RepID=UPI0018926CC1|nr:hypothetical protein [Catenulispora rubra]
MRSTGGTNPGRVGVSGCSYLNDHHVENDATITQKVQSLRIDNPAGQIMIHAGDTGGGVVVHRDIDYHIDQPPTPGQTVTGGVLDLTSGCGDSCGIAYDVTVPASVAVTVVDHAGEVSVAVPNGAHAVDASSKAGARTVDVPYDPAASHHVKVSSDAGAVSVTSA